MKKSLLLVNPSGENVSSLAPKIVPLSLGYIAALTPEDWNIQFVDENTEKLDISNYDVDLVALTSMTSNAPRAYAIAQKFKRKGVKTVIGGIHATALPKEAKKFVDSVVIGEAEGSWPILIKDFEKKQLRPFYKSEFRSLENLPIPKNFCSAKHSKVALVQTARGCPMDCDFCSVGLMNGKVMRLRPVNDVLNELEQIKSPYVFFADDNILGYGKKAEERFIELCKGMIERGIKKRWASQAWINFVDNPEIPKIAKASGCVGLLVGFESIGALERLSKNKSKITGKSIEEKYREVVNKFHRNGIPVIGSFIFGSDYDREDISNKITNFICRTRIDLYQLTILTPLPGTRFFKRMRREKRLLYNNFPEDWKHFNFGEVVFKPLNTTAEKLQESISLTYKKLANTSTSIKRAFSTFKSTKSFLIALFYYFSSKKYSNGFFEKYS